MLSVCVGVQEARTLNVESFLPWRLKQMEAAWSPLLLVPLPHDRDGWVVTGYTDVSSCARAFHSMILSTTM